MCLQSAGSPGKDYYLPRGMARGALTGRMWAAGEKEQQQGKETGWARARGRGSSATLGFEMPPGEWRCHTLMGKLEGEEFYFI